MSLESLIKELKNLLSQCTSDLEKAEQGNKAAAQRVRTGTVKLEKTAKLFRKESIVAEKKGVFDKAKKAKKKASSKKPEPKKEQKSQQPAKKAVKVQKPVKKATKVQKPVKKVTKAKTTAHKKVLKPAPLSLKKGAAKLSQKRMGW